jgi:hypothetical protein
MLRDNNEGKQHAINENHRLFNQNVAKLNSTNPKWHALRHALNLFIHK